MTAPIRLFQQKRVWIPATLFVIYTLFGFFVLPPILRRQIVSGIRQNLKREARLDRVRVNPLALSLTLEGFELRDPDGTPFVAWDRMYVGFQLSSLVRWAITLRAFELDAPRIRVRLMPDGKPNFDDLIPKENGKPPRLVVGRFAIHRGSVRVTNLAATPVQDATIIPIELDLRNFTTIPRKEGNYEITAVDPGQGSWHWVGDLTFEPMHSAGVLEISGTKLASLADLVKDLLPVAVADGQFGCRFEYRVDARGDSLTARVHDSSIAVTNVALEEKKSHAGLMHLDSLVVSGIALQFPEQTLGATRVLVAGATVQVRVAPDTSINWLTALALPGGSPGSAARPSGSAAPGRAAAAPPARATSPAAAPGVAAPAWNGTLSELAVRSLDVEFEDQTVNPPFQSSVAPVDVTVRNLDTRPGAKFDLLTDATIARQGHLTVKGTVSAQPLAGDLEVQLADLPLPIFQPYLNDKMKLSVVSGTFGVAGTAHIRAGAKQPDVAFQGGMESKHFLSRDRVGGEPFVSWDAVHVDGIDFSSARLGIRTVRIDRPYSKVLIHKDRTTNFQDVLGASTLDSAAAAHEAATPGPALDAHGKRSKAPQPKASEALAQMQKSAAAATVRPVRIGSITVTEGSADFADLSLVLPFAARIEHLKGGVTSLSSDSASRADVRLDGALQPSGTAQVTGTVNPLAQRTFLDLAVAFHDFNMPTLTPYSGEFLGRTIDKGRMSMDLGYRLEGRHLVGKNKITLDQLELGDKVESPEATHLPVGLAIAILKDKDGRIDLDVPVEGDVDDPNFRIGKVIWNFIMSLLKKVATAPFALLGGLFGGGGDQMGQVQFDVGSATLAPDQGESLTHLAGALGKRPQLKLDVRGRSDRNADGAALRKAKFTALAGERMAADPRKYGGGLGYSTRLLDDLAVEKLGKSGAADFRARFMKPAGELDPGAAAYKAGSSKPVFDESAWGRAIQDTLTALQPVDDADLLALANGRGAAIKQHLVAQGIEESRIFLLDPEPFQAEAGRIRIDLALKD